MKTFEFIKNLRKLSRLTQADIAAFLEMSRPNYGNKENGNTTFTADEMFSVLSILKNQISPELFNKEVGLFFKARINFEDFVHFDSDSNGPSIPIATDNDIGKTTTQEASVIEEHQKLIKQFQDHHAGKEVTEYMLRIENINKREFYKAIGDLKGLLSELEERETRLPGKPYQKTGTEYHK